MSLIGIKSESVLLHSYLTQQNNNLSFISIKNFRRNLSYSRHEKRKCVSFSISFRTCLHGESVTLASRLTFLEADVGF